MPGKIAGKCLLLRRARPNEQTLFSFFIRFFFFISLHVACNERACLSAASATGRAAAGMLLQREREEGHKSLAQGSAGSQEHASIAGRVFVSVLQRTTAAGYVCVCATWRGCGI